MDGALAGLSCCQIVQSFAGFAVVIYADVEIGSVGFLIDARKQCGESLRNSANNPEVQVAAPSQLLLADIDLQNASILRIKLLVGEIRSQPQQRITVHHSVIARGEDRKSTRLNSSHLG